MASLFRGGAFGALLPDKLKPKFLRSKKTKKLKKRLDALEAKSVSDQDLRRQTLLSQSLGQGRPTTLG
ncbi:MAG: hypothetical protein ACE5FA_01475 [Dehalococcoidia bacterium]